MDKIEHDLLTQFQFVRRWGPSWQCISKLALEGSLPMFEKMVDVPLPDQFIQRNGVELICIGYSHKEREKYLKRLEKPKGLVD